MSCRVCRSLISSIVRICKRFPLWLETSSTCEEIMEIWSSSPKTWEHHLYVLNCGISQNAEAYSSNILLFVQNDYSETFEAYRPSHANFLYDKKYVHSWDSRAVLDHLQEKLSGELLQELLKNILNMKVGTEVCCSEIQCQDYRKALEK